METELVHFSDDTEEATRKEIKKLFFGMSAEMRMEANENCNLEKMTSRILQEFLVRWKDTMSFFISPSLLFPAGHRRSI